MCTMIEKVFFEGLFKKIRCVCECTRTNTLTNTHYRLFPPRFELDALLTARRWMTFTVFSFSSSWVSGRASPPSPSSLSSSLE